MNQQNLKERGNKGPTSAPPRREAASFNTTNHPPRSIPRKFSKDQKIQFVRDWEISGESKLMHSQKAGVHITTFQDWIHRFGQSAPKTRSVFIPAHIVPKSPDLQPLEIQLPGGASISVHGTSDLDTLAHLLHRLETTKC
jgi:hypothetical protein